MDARLTDADISRFWSKVERRGPEACWPWKGTFVRDGYGQLGWSRKGMPRGIGAHRLSYTLSIGTIPQGLLVCHTCDNRGCVNPGHLFIGTHADNMADMVRKGRRKPTAARGSRHGQAKLTEARVVEIRILRNKGTSYRLIARQFGVTPGAIYSIVKRRLWAHVP